MNIRKLIIETLETVVNKEQVEKKFDQDIIYLKGFKLSKKENKGNSEIWIFQHKQKDYILRFYIQHNKKDDNWVAKVFIYWKEASKNFTNAKGKDYEHTFGPFSSYEEMIEELNRKLKNNPLISTDSYMDDDNTQFDKDVVVLLKKILTQGKKISLVKDSHFKELKKIYNDVKDIKTMDELNNYITKKAPDEEDKQTLLLTLQRMYQLDFYINKEQIESLF